MCLCKLIELILALNLLVSKEYRTISSSSNKKSRAFRLTLVSLRHKGLVSEPDLTWLLITMAYALGFQQLTLFIHSLDLLTVCNVRRHTFSTWHRHLLLSLKGKVSSHERERMLNIIFQVDMNMKVIWHNPIKAIGFWI